MADLRGELVPRPAGRPTSCLGTDSAGRDSCSGAAASLCSRRLASSDVRKQVFRDSGLKSGGGGGNRTRANVQHGRGFFRIPHS